MNNYDAGRERATQRTVDTAAPASLPENYVDLAEKVMLEFSQSGDGSTFTTSKIRNILSLITAIENDVAHSSETILSKELQSRIQHMRVRLVYEGGREPAVKAFIEKTNLVEYIKQVGSSREKFDRLAQYMEALVAYHRYYNGRDN